MTHLGCIGSIDGKHIKMIKPSKSGSLYFNYKRGFSIVLMAISDANYRFRVAAIGAPGANNDAGVFASTVFGRKLLDAPHELPLPADKMLPNTQIRSPCVFVGDDAFRLMKHLMKQYTGRDLSHDEEIFNYRLSRLLEFICPECGKTFNSSTHVKKRRFKSIRSYIEFFEYSNVGAFPVMFYLKFYIMC